MKKSGTVRYFFIVYDVSRRRNFGVTSATGWKPVLLLPLAAADATDDEVFVLAFFEPVAAEAAFLLHVELGEDAAGGGVAGQVVGEDAVELQLVEGILEDSLGGFGAIAFVPIRPADPVAHFGVV